MTAAVFLDRDGTLIEEVGYLDRLERLTIYPWSIDAVRLLNRAGFKVVVLTNQAGVARGLVRPEFVEEAHDFLTHKFEAGGARIDGFYYCPHHPDAPLAAYRQQCQCRKPQPGMMRQAARDLSIDLGRSYMIGDRWLDVQMGLDLGAKSILVRTGYGASEERFPREGLTPSVTVSNLIEGVGWILRRESEVSG